MSNEIATRDQMGIQMVEEGAPPQSVVEYAVSKGVTPEALEKLIALQERVANRDARMAFYAALAAFRAECPQPQHNRTSDQFTRVNRAGVKEAYSYADLSEIDMVARPVAAKYGLSWMWNTRMGGDQHEVTCRLMHVLGHFEDASITMPLESRAGASAQQKTGIANKYGMRLSLVMALGITTADTDMDGNTLGGETITESQAADLYAILTEVQADEGRFLALLGVEKLSDLPAVSLPIAVRALEGKRGKK